MGLRGRQILIDDEIQREGFLMGMKGFVFLMSIINRSLQHLYGQLSVDEGIIFQSILVYERDVGVLSQKHKLNILKQAIRR